MSSQLRGAAARRDDRTLAAGQRGNHKGNNKKEEVL